MFVIDLWYTCKTYSILTHTLIIHTWRTYIFTGWSLINKNIQNISSQTEAKRWVFRFKFSKHTKVKTLEIKVLLLKYFVINSAVRTGDAATFLSKGFWAKMVRLSLSKLKAMGVGRGAVPPPWIFKHGTNIVDRGLEVLFFGLFFLFLGFFPLPLSSPPRKRQIVLFFGIFC